MQPASLARAAPSSCDMHFAKLGHVCPLQQLKQSLSDHRKLYENLLIAGASLTASFYSTWNFQPSAKISVAHGCLLFALGGCFFTALYRCAQAAIAHTDWGVRRLVKAHHLTPPDILDIANKLVSSTQALFCCITGYVVWGHSCCTDVVRANHFVSHAYAWFGSAYFFYDIWSMYTVHVRTPPGGRLHTPSTLLSTPSGVQHGDVQLSSGVRRFLRYVRLNPIIVGHHLFIGIFGFAVIIYLRGNLGDCVFGFVYMMEASTPFVSVRSVLARFHMKQTRLYMYNGFLMLLVFFVCRVAMFPYVVHVYASSAQLSYADAVYALPRGCKVSISILMFPQIYWFLLMIKGATKLMMTAAPSGGVCGELGDRVLPSDGGHCKHTLSMTIDAIVSFYMANVFTVR